MKGPKATSIAHKKLDSDTLKKRKAEESATKKQKAYAKKCSGAPKRPPSAFFVFMEEFRKTFKENFPDNKSVAIVGKAGGEKWKSMSNSEKSPYVEKAAKKKADYEVAMKDFNTNTEREHSKESEKSSEINNGAEQEASS